MSVDGRRRAGTKVVQTAEKTDFVKNVTKSARKKAVSATASPASCYTVWKDNRRGRSPVFFLPHHHSPATVASMADPTAILADLVRRPSVNPMGRDLVGPEYLEGRVTDYLLRRLETAGIAAVRQPVAAGRDNVIARLPATVADAPVLIWDVHQDTVPVSGMIIEPFTPTVRDGRLAGRGACDVKGGWPRWWLPLSGCRLPWNGGLRSFSWPA